MVASPRYAASASTASNSSSTVAMARCLVMALVLLRAYEAVA
jgi:hypothetical protein